MNCRYRFAAIVLLMLAASASVPGQGAAPASTMSLSGLKASVTIRRDARSIPYIHASTDADMYFAQGYATASDRLWQMDLFRRRARGETAEVFGRAALDSDKLWRRYGFSAIADESMKYLSPDSRAILESYSAGVNAYLATLTPETLPSEFRILQYRPGPWNPTDTIVIGKILADALSTTWPQDMTAASARQKLSPEKLADVLRIEQPDDVVLFGSDKVREKPAKAGLALVDRMPMMSSAVDDLTRMRRKSLEEIGLYIEGLAASNNWVISGKLTKDGRALLANDPHLPAMAPGIWYLTHLSSPSGKVAGVTFPGVPGIVLGHNEHYSWGATNLGPDVQDLYLETFNAEGKYRTPDGWQSPTVRREVIKVRKDLLKPGSDDATFEVTETRNGVVFLEEGDKKYSLKWTARDPRNSELDAFFAIDRGRNWKDFTDALRQYGGAAQNFVFADSKGSIGWYAAGRIPIRRNGDGSLPYDGASNDGDWVGMIPFDELPHLFDPPSGLIVTANQRVVGTDYRYQQVSRAIAPPWRARRILDRLKDRKSLTIADAFDVQQDIYNIPFTQLSKYIVASGAASPETIAALRQWDGMMRAESAAAPLVNEIVSCTTGKISEANGQLPAYVIRDRVLFNAVEKGTTIWLPPDTKDLATLVRSCDATARAVLSDPKRLGPDAEAWRWDKYVAARFSHPLAAAPLIGTRFVVQADGISGSGQTPNVGPNVSMRHVSSPGNWDETIFAIPLGESGDPASPYFKDQLTAWKAGTPQKFPFSEKGIAAATVSVLRLEPGKLPMANSTLGRP